MIKKMDENEMNIKNIYERFGFKVEKCADEESGICKGHLVKSDGTEQITHRGGKKHAKKQGKTNLKVMMEL